MLNVFLRMVRRPQRGGPVALAQPGGVGGWVGSARLCVRPAPPALADFPKAHARHQPYEYDNKIRLSTFFVILEAILVDPAPAHPRSRGCPSPATGPLLPPATLAALDACQTRIPAAGPGLDIPPTSGIIPLCHKR
jgi:hypothetical protein